jgi:uncharacterized membrane-anchored protein YhcB (DUF1043 family)
MLDVHPAPHAARSWRDFFVHIATIVIGLLIAIGLEQSVEWLHHRHQVEEARRALESEREANQAEFARTTQLFRRETRRFQTNLAVFEYLRQHPGAPATALPGKISWHSYIANFSTAAWQTAQHVGATAMLPQPEVRAYEELYYHLSVVQASSWERVHSISAARRYTALDADPSDLTPAQITELSGAAEAVLIAHYRLGSDMRNLHEQHIDFAPSPETDELRAIVHEEPITDAERRELGLR